MPIETPDPSLIAPPAVSGFSKFLEGAGAPVRGFRYLNRNPGLWRFAIFPLLLNLLITTAALLALIAVAVWFFTKLHPWMTQSLDDVATWIAVTVEVLVGIVLLALTAIVTIVLWKILSGVLCGFFYGRLAEQIERELGATDDELQPLSLLHELVDTVLNLTILVVVNLAILMLNILPLFGGLLAVVCGCYFTWYMLGLDYLNLPLSLRGMRRTKQFGFAHRHRMHTTGLGSAVFLFGFIPVVGAVLLTTAVVGAVLLHRRIRMHHEPD